MVSFLFWQKKHVWVGFAGESWGDSFFLGSCCGRARNLVNKKQWSSEEWMKSTDKMYIYIYLSLLIGRGGQLKTSSIFEVDWLDHDVPWFLFGRCYVNGVLFPDSVCFFVQYFRSLVPYFCEQPIQNSNFEIQTIGSMYGIFSYIYHTF